MTLFLSQPVRTLYRYRSMIGQMTRREIMLPYAGQMFGVIWPIVHPLALVLLYAIVFSFVFATQFGGTADMPYNYTVYLLSGLVPWIAFSAVLSRAPLEIVSNSNLVKQVIFPLEVLPVRAVTVSLVAPAISLLFLLVYTLLTGGSLPWTYVLLPLAVALEIVWMLGAAFFLSALGVYFRDVKDFINVFVLASLYLLPVIYLPSAVPPILRGVVDLNPFSAMILCFRDVLYFGRVGNPLAWVAYAGSSILSFYVGYYVFQRLRPFFGNVL